MGVASSSMDPASSSMGVASSSTCVALGVALGALSPSALVEAKRCCHEPIAVAVSDLGKAVIPSVVDNSVWKFSIAGGQWVPKTMRLPSYVFISSSFVPGAWDAPVLD